MCPDSVYGDEARSAAQLVPTHRDRQVNAGVVSVDSDRERNPVFVQEGFKRDRRHSLAVLEHTVKAQHRDSVAERALDSLSLRDPVRNTTRAEDLERLDHHHLTSESGQCRIVIGVEPATNR